VSSSKPARRPIPEITLPLPTEIANELNQYFSKKFCEEDTYGELPNLTPKHVTTPMPKVKFTTE